MSKLLGDAQLERYSRQILLPQIDIKGQQRLLDTHVLLIGIGGLGSPAAMYLASSGIGKISLCDYDHIDLSNLHRQITYNTADIGAPKAETAKKRLLEINPDIEVNAINFNLHDSRLTNQIRQADIVIDASDNFDTRYLINRNCISEDKPLVSGSATQMKGQVSVFNGTDTSPCYHCLYPDKEAFSPATGNCNDNGIFPPIVGLIGSFMAAETIKLALGLGSSLDGKLLLIDSMTMACRHIAIQSDPNFPKCGARDTR